MIDFLKNHIDLSSDKTGEELVEMWRKCGFLATIPTHEGEIACARTLNNVAQAMLRHPGDYNRWQGFIIPIMVRLYNGCTHVGYTEEPLHYTGVVNVNDFLLFVRTTALSDWFYDVLALKADYNCIHMVVGSWFKSFCKIVSFDPSKTLDDFAGWLDDDTNKKAVTDFQREHLLSQPDFLAEFCAMVSQLFGMYLTKKDAQRLTPQDKRGYNGFTLPRPTTTEEIVNYWRNIGFVAGVNQEQEKYLIETFDSVFRAMENPEAVVDEVWDSFVLPFLRRIIVNLGLNRTLSSDEFFDLVDNVTVSELIEKVDATLSGNVDNRSEEELDNVTLRNIAVELVNKYPGSGDLTMTCFVKYLKHFAKEDPSLGYFNYIDWEVEFSTVFTWLIYNYMVNKEAPAE